MDSIESTPPPDIAAAPILLFRAAGETYGCTVGSTQEIVQLQPMTRLPGAPAFVRGLVNVRGTIATVLDLGMRLDPSRSPTEAGSVLLVRYRDRVVGVIVDEVVDVRSIAIEDREPERAGGDAGKSIVAGMASWDGAPVMVLDFDGLFRQVLLS